MKNWFKVKNMAEGQLKISINDEIGGFGISAAYLIEQVNSADGIKEIKLDIHSPGGNFLDGLAIYNVLKSHPARVHAHVNGIAASAATLPLMAGDVRTMPEDAFIMIHNPSGFIAGESSDMRELADVMDTMKQSSVNIYSQRTELGESELVQMLDKQSWLPSDQALSLGFVDAITDAVNVAAKASAFSNYFEKLPFNVENNGIDQISTITGFERYLRDVCNVSKKQATALASRAKFIAKGDLSQNSTDEDMQKLSAALMRFKVPESLHSQP